MHSGIIFDLQEFAVHDGPGVRLTVFLKGCPLHCRWCHNPEGISPLPQILRGSGWTRQAGRSWTAVELAQRIDGMAAILTAAGGGVTFSGGEVLAQADFVLETIAALQQPVHLLADTSGYGNPEQFRALAQAVDLLFFGLKLADPDIHRRFTGVDNRLILDNLAILKTLATPFVVRIPLIPGVTDTDENLKALAVLLRDSPNLLRVDLLPYNPAAGAKYAAAGMTFDPGFDEKCPLNLNPQPFRVAGINANII